MSKRPFLVLLASFGLGCAASPAGASPERCVEAPEPEPSPKVSSQRRPMPESVSVRLFVVASSGDPQTGVPDEIRAEPVCEDGECEVLYAPLVVGREHTEMVLEIADRQAPSLLSVNTEAAVRGDAVDVKLNGRFISEAGPMSVQFQGALQTGQLTHIGTFNGHDAEVGPHIYATVSSSSADDA